MTARNRHSMLCVFVMMLIVSVACGATTPAPAAAPTPSPETVATGIPTPPPVGAIQGEVTDLGNPVPGAEVTAWPGLLKAKTDSNGRYGFNSVRAGEAYVRAEEAAHGVRFKSVMVLAGQTITADIDLAQVIPACSIRNLPSIKGRVLLGNSLPAVGAMVGIDGPNFEPNTDNNGEYQFNNVCAYHVRILALSRDMRGSVEVDLTPGMTTTAPDIILTP